MIGARPSELIAVAENRCITINKKANIGDQIKVKIVRDKHNIFKGII